MHTGNMTKTAARKPKVIETRLTVTPVVAVSADATPLFMGGRKTGWWTKSLYLSPNHLKHLYIAQRTTKSFAEHQVRCRCTVRDKTQPEHKQE